MAYCKSCGNPIKDEDAFCKNCGGKVERLEQVDASQVEIVKKKRKMWFSFHNADYTNEVLENNAIVFDKKIMGSLLCALLLFTLEFFIRSVDLDIFNAASFFSAIFFIAAIVPLLVGIIIRNRGVILLSLMISSAGLIGNGIVELASMQFETLVILQSVLSAFVNFTFSGVCIILSIEMLTGKRLLGFHCAAVVLISIALLLEIILTLILTPPGDMGILVTLWQVLNVFGKVTCLGIVIFLFSNLGKIGIKAKF